MTNILGIDPGTHRVGWAVVSGTIQHPTLVDSGCLDLPPKSDSASYLPQISALVTSLIQRHNPQVAGLEKLFAQHNQKTVISVSQARGVILLALVKNGVSLCEYSPTPSKRPLPAVVARAKPR